MLISPWDITLAEVMAARSVAAVVAVATTETAVAEATEQAAAAVEVITIQANTVTAECLAPV
jgi:hypothetical protein